MGEASLLGMMERTSSIENEPRTLRLHQIQCARDAALYVLRTRSIEEALAIFTEGLQPVVSLREQNNSPDQDCDESDSREQLLFPRPRDVVSAPF